jgi:hypothetical protein
MDHYSYVWWEVERNTKEMYHVRTRIPGREGLLVDVGAVENVVGDAWVKRVSDILKLHNKKVQTMPMEKLMTLQGVGSGNSICNHKVVVPIKLASGQEGTFSAPVITGSDIPALLGLRSLREKRCLIDVCQRKLIQVGEGGYQLTLSPGSVCHELEIAPSGHLILPVAEWNSSANSEASPPFTNSQPFTKTAASKSAWHMHSEF